MINKLSTLLQNNNYFFQCDLKEIGASVLSSQLESNKIGKLVLQIQKLRNVSAPKSNEESQAAPRMLKLILTDGHTHSQAVEISQVNNLHHTRTPPGTKLLINGAKISNGFILIDSKCCTVLGGKVSALHERWELAKSISKNSTQRAVNGKVFYINYYFLTVLA